MLTDEFKKHLLAEAELRPYKEMIDACQEILVRDAFYKNNCRRDLTSKELGISRCYLLKLLRKYKIIQERDPEQIAEALTRIRGEEDVV